MSKTTLVETANDQWRILTDLLGWIPLATLVGALAGTASALLLVSLNWATDVREAHHWIIALLPAAGYGVGWVYQRVGQSVAAGNNLILQEIDNPTGVIPLRMTPLILAGTIITHLFGGSAGREGTAIQTGASLADQLTHLFRLSPLTRRIVLMTGISAGFASVFGTPLAGAVFGMEVLAFGALTYEALVPCTLAAFAGDLTTRAWHVHHTVYTVHELPPLGVTTLLSAVAAGICFGLMALLFARLTHAIGHLSKLIPSAPMRPVVGGVLVAVAVFSLGTTKYVGLGIPTIVASFDHQLPIWDFAAKTVFTSVTLGTGFKGGEVTPLFYIGATLGNALSNILPLPTSLLAGMGFVAVFAGAANTPLASTFMAFELFGGEAGAFCAVACVLSYLFSGHDGIYSAQRLGFGKVPGYSKLAPAPSDHPELVAAKEHVLPDGPPTRRAGVSTPF
ncbi:voltage-gated chloride channel family protein [Granulicella sp. WH15]|uniref:voltage-gated chloride channel family protein n=1 Tax=Granulicella sp. WH15 TaxID=2602070 RepID=UPI0021071444|nr:voltage-gated chloride channel family protein [Granulicella sp. WH15]